jgi:hypothetical protein
LQPALSLFALRQQVEVVVPFREEAAFFLPPFRHFRPTWVGGSGQPELDVDSVLAPPSRASKMMNLLGGAGQEVKTALGAYGPKPWMRSDMLQTRATVEPRNAAFVEPRPRVLIESGTCAQSNKRESKAKS